MKLMPELTIRTVYPDGRVTGKVVWPDGEWKIEVFASLEHAQQFASENNLAYNYVPERE
jgi:hypothetical protein